MDEQADADLGREFVAARRSGLFALRRTGDPETPRWPAIDDTGPLLQPNEAILWRGSGCIVSYSAERGAPMTRTFVAWDGHGNDPRWVSTDRRLLYSWDYRAEKVMIERKATKAFRKEHALAGQIQYAWMNYLRYDSRWWEPGRAWISFDVRTDERMLRLMVALDRWTKKEALLKDVLRSALGREPSGPTSTETRRGKKIRVFDLHPESHLPGDEPLS